jgi:hypothetical protein
LGGLLDQLVYSKRQNRLLLDLLLRQQLHDQLLLIDGPKADAAVTHGP